MGAFAWVTLATNDSYSLGALVLAHSLRQVGTTQQLAVLVTPGVTASMREKLSSVFNVVQEVNILDSRDEANLRLLKRPELGVTFTKLHCWRLTQFDKCVFLDADTLVLQNCDELFERDELSAAPDVGWPDCFNSGVFVYRPSNETYTSLVEFAIERGSFDGGDQGLLNLYFSDWAHKDINKHLPFIYNLCSTACYSYLPAFKQFGGGAKIIHFIGNSKPWLQYFDTETQLVHPSEGLEHLRGIIQHWWSIFCSSIHPNLTPDMGGLAGAFAQLTLGAPRTPEQRALDDHLRRQGWEVGNIDYLGKDSFDNIWSKICETLATAPPSTQPKEPTPPLTEVQPAVETVIAEQAAVQETQISQTPPPAQTPQETDSPAPPADSLPSAPADSSEIPSSEPQTLSEESAAPKIPLEPASLPAQPDLVPPEVTVLESSEKQAPTSAAPVPVSTDSQAPETSDVSQAPSTPTTETPREAVPVVAQAQSAVPETVPAVKESAPVVAEPSPVVVPTAVSESTQIVTEQTSVAESTPATESASEVETPAIAEPSPASVKPQVSAETIPATPVESTLPSSETPTAPVISPTETPAVSTATPVKAPSAKSVAESPQTPPSPQSSPQVCPIVPKSAPAPPSKEPSQKDSTPSKTAQTSSKQSQKSAAAAAVAPSSPKPETQQAPPLQCTLPSKTQPGPESPKVTAQEAQKPKPEEKTQESSGAPAPQSPTGSGPTPPPRKASSGQKKTTKPKK